MSRVWTAIERALKWFAVTLLGLLALAVVLFGVAFVVNGHDEPLSPQAVELLRPPANPYRPEDNLYLAIEGFDAPPGESVIATGQARIARYNQSIDAVLRDPSPAKLKSLRARDAHRLDFNGDVRLVQPLEGSVWSEAVRHQEEIRRLLADNRELYQRYLDLMPLRAYCETARPSDFAPYPIAPGEVHKLFLAAIALHMRSRFPSERERALADLQIDVQMWRVILPANGALVGKMQALASLQSDYLLLADLLADGQLALPPGAEEADSLVPLFDLRDWDIGQAFAAEFRFLAAVLRQTDEQSAVARSPDGAAHGGLLGWLSGAENRVTGHFLKLNATQNLMAGQTAQRMQAAADPAKFYATRQPPGGGLFRDQSVWRLPLSYNPVGRVLAAVATPSYDNYTLRAWDAAALQRLVRCGYEIRRERIDAAGIPAFLRQHPEWSTHPADGRPFIWDAARGELRVQTVAQQPPGRRFTIPVWRSLAPPAPPR